MRQISHRSKLTKLPYCLLVSGLILLPLFAKTETVTLQLKWLHQFQFAGYYMAAEKGFYRDRGLEVIINQADVGAEPTQVVLDGKADFGVSSTDLLMRRAKGEPVVVLATIFQHSPLELVGRVDKGIHSIHDLIGRRIMIESDAALLIAYLNYEGIPKEKVIWQYYNLNIQPFLAGEVDALSVYATDEPFIFEQMKIPVTQMRPRASGIDFYGDNLFTLESQIQQHPERVKKFLEASLLGWKYAMAHQEEAVQVILNHYPSKKSAAHLRFEAEHMSPLVRTELVEIGYMNPGRWKRIAEIYHETGMLPQVPNLNGFLYDPDPKPDLRWLYGTLFGALLLLIIVTIIHFFNLRLNRKLKSEVKTRVEAERKLTESEARYRLVYETAPLAFLLWNQERKITGWNKAAERIFGWKAEEVVGRDVFAFLLPPEEQEVFERVLLGQDWSKDPIFMLLRNRTKQGHEVLCEWSIADGQAQRGGAKAGALTLALDVTARKTLETELHQANLKLQQQLGENLRLQAQLRELATRDALTGLLNRHYLEETLPREWARAQRDKKTIALVMIDVDHFKLVNDTYGHLAGDQVLLRIAQLLTEALRAGDIICRYGGEEFLIIMPGANTETLTERTSIWRQRCEAETFSWEGQHFKVTISIGIASYPTNGQSIAEVTSAADQALYRAKKRGRNRIETFENA